MRTNRSIPRQALLFSLSLFMLGCGDDDVSEPDSGGADAGRSDSGFDARTSGDAGPDVVTNDAGPDASVECDGEMDCEDDNECTTNMCVSNECRSVPLAMGTTCSAGVCNGGGTAASACVECTLDSQCISGVCNPITNECSTGCTEDAGCDDSIRCTGDLCIAGSCVNTPLPQGRACPTEAGSPDGVCREDTLACVECVSRTDCSGDTQTCNATNECSACASDSECDDANDCTANACDAGACVTTALTVGTACDGGVCSASSECVGCTTSAQCGGATPVCDASASTCVQCVQDSECSAPERCDLGTNLCVSCLGAADCDDDDDCTADTCAGGLCRNDALPEGSSCAIGVCRVDQVCVACIGNAQCSGAAPTCDAVTNMCVSCLEDASCDDANDCTLDTCSTGMCANSMRPAGSTCSGGVCDAASMCVGCLASPDCGAQQCDSMTQMCVDCLTDADCMEAGATCGPTQTCLSCVGPTCPGLPEHLWAEVYDSGAGDTGWSVALDSDGNVFVAGLFQGTFSLPLPGGLSSLTSRGSSDVFVFKLDAAGSILWARAFGSTAGEGIPHLAVDSSDNVYVTGNYAGAAVNAGGADLPFADGDRTNVYVMSFTAGGGHRWSRGFSGAGDDAAQGIAVAGSSVYVVGGFSGTFQPGSAPLTGDGTDAFVMQLQASDGLTGWSRAYGGMATQQARAVGVDASGMLRVAGIMQEMVDFGGAGSISADGQLDLFVLKINSAGAEIDVVNFGGLNASVIAQDIAVAPSGEVIIAGVFGGTVRFLGPPVTGAFAPLVLALDNNLSPRWFHSFDINLTIISVIAGGMSVALDGDQVLVAGVLSGSVTLAGTGLVSNGERDVYIASMALTDGALVGGTLHWAFGFGSTEHDVAFSVAAQDGRLVVTGRAGGEIDYGSGAVFAEADNDMFVSSYRIR